MRAARALTLAIACVSLGACQFDPPTQGARDESVPALTVEGYGDMRIGMPIAEARQVSGQPLDAPALEEGVPGACAEQEYTTADGDKLYLMFEGDVITRISASEEATRTRTDQNVGVGSTAEEVRTAYQNAIQQGAHYSDPPAHNLIVWTVPQQRGLLFEVNEQGIVTAVHAGTDAIQYMEGCA